MFRRLGFFLSAPEDPIGSPAPAPEPEKKKEPAPAPPKKEPELEVFTPPTKTEISAMSESTAHGLLEELRIFNGTKKEQLKAPVLPVPGVPEPKKEPEKKSKRKLGWFEFD